MKDADKIRHDACDQSLSDACVAGTFSLCDRADRRGKHDQFVESRPPIILRKHLTLLSTTRPPEQRSALWRSPIGVSDGIEISSIYPFMKLDNKTKPSQPLIV